MNRLANESSPYLRQHAENPVDWYPWGEEARAKARAEDKPIFLSIGYSACHWCHVMAHESFEDQAIASFLNEHFVSIKVDREERPDLDRVYMAAVQAMTGNGGWPMSVFMTPEGKPFYAGTYFPPIQRYGMPPFRRVLESIAEAWAERRDEVLRSSEQVAAFIQPKEELHPRDPDQMLDAEILNSALQTLEATFDQTHGGWGVAPKFPQEMVIEFLLRLDYRTGAARARPMAERTLEAMARGGIYDQIGGGFHRYSVDDHWLVPHFEKMLYDNAQLARVYLHAWQATGNELFRSVAEETLDYVLREMTDPSGGFYSSQDADTEGEEGKFYLWTLGDIEVALGEEAAAFRQAYTVTAEGNFEGKNILSLVGDKASRASLADARRRLRDLRAQRVHPGRDEKVLTSWNGLMLAALAEAAQILGRDDYRQAAERNADFLLRELRTPNGRLYHTWKDGQARVNGYLEDYTHLSDGLLALYEATFEVRWYTAARELADLVMAHFQAPQGFYDTSDDHEALIVRPKELQDNATPSGNAMATWVLLRLANLAQDPLAADEAVASLRAVVPMLGRYPTAFAQWLVALDYALAPHREIAIVGDPASPDTRALIAAARMGYGPYQIMAVGQTEQSDVIPLLGNRASLQGRATAYVCYRFTCYPPVSEPAALQALLSRPALEAGNP